MSATSPDAAARPRGAGWGEETDTFISGDLATALAYVTPAQGAVVAPITTAGVRDREAGTVMLTTSLAFGKKLERIRREDRVALAFHAREHGFADGPEFVLVQGRATIGWTDPAAQGKALARGTRRFFSTPKSSRFWRWWMHEYYMERVPVTVAVERVTSWPDSTGDASPTVHGLPLPPAPPGSQAAPNGGVAPRIAAGRAGARLRRLPHLLLGWVDADGFPAVAPVSVAAADREGLTLHDPTGAVPSGGRRAGLLGHGFGPELTALRARQHTGWLEAEGGEVRYAPHTEQHYRTPRGTTATSFVNGGRAKRALRRARCAEARVAP